MTFKEFSEEFARLLTVYGRVNPNDDQAREWYKSLNGVRLSDLVRAIDQCRDSETEFPASLAVVWTYIRNLEGVRIKRPSCDHCQGGRIFFSRMGRTLSVNGHSLIRDVYLACDCPSGDLVADDIVRAWEKRGLQVRVAQASRYSWRWQRFGGLETAKAGFGVSTDRMPEPVYDDGKGEAPKLEDHDLERSMRGE